MAVPGRGVGVATDGVLVNCRSIVGVIVGVVGADTGVIVGTSVAGRIGADVGVAVGTIGTTTTTGGVGVPGKVLTKARRLKYPANEPTQSRIPTSIPPRMTAVDQSRPAAACDVGTDET